MNFKAPHFVLFESSSDPFSGIVGRIFKHSAYPFERVEIQDVEQAKELDFYQLINIIIFGIPLTKLPAIQFDNITIAGLSAVCRSIATRVGLDGCSLNESSEIDMIVSFIEQEMEKFKPVLNSDKQKEQELMAEIGQFLNNLAPFLEARFRTNNGLKTVVGKRITWADFVLVSFLRTLIAHFDDDFLTFLEESYPNMLEYFRNNQNL